MLEGERGEMCVPHEIAGGPGLLEQAAEERKVPASRLDYDGRRSAEPDLDGICGLADGQGAHKDGSVRGQAQKREDDGPCERNGFAAAECRRDVGYFVGVTFRKPGGSSGSIPRRSASASASCCARSAAGRAHSGSLRPPG